jgi:hypothetical protein
MTLPLSERDHGDISRSRKAPIKNTGQIRLHGEEGFEGMRRPAG